MRYLWREKEDCDLLFFKGDGETLLYSLFPTFALITTFRTAYALCTVNFMPLAV